VGVKGRSRSLDGVPDFAQVTHLALGGYQLLLGLLLLVLHVPVCVGHINLLMLLGLLGLPLLHLSHVHLQHWGLDLVAGVCGKNMQVLVSLEGGSGLLDSTSNVVVGGHLVVWGVLEGGECRLRASQSLLSDGHLCSNPLGLAVHDNFHVVLVLGLCHGNPLGLGVLGLGGNDLGDSGGGGQRSASTATPQTCPWSCSVMIVGQTLRIVDCQSP
jgi:hypothetical protein